MNIRELQREAHAIAKEHGWWDATESPPEAPSYSTTGLYPAALASIMMICSYWRAHQTYLQKWRIGACLFTFIWHLSTMVFIFEYLNWLSAVGENRQVIVLKILFYPCLMVLTVALFRHIRFYLFNNLDLDTSARKAFWLRS